MRSSSTVTGDLSASDRRRGFVALGTAVLCVGFAITLQMALNSNFVADEMGLSGQQQGILESIRETCGILALLVVAALAVLAEPILAALMLVLFSVGLGGTAWVGKYGSLIAINLVWSQGLHVWMPLPNSMMLALAEPGRTGHRLGQMSAIGAVGAGLALISGLVLTHLGVPIRTIYIIAGAAAMVGAIACLGIPMRIRLRRPRFVLRKAYWRYYLLQFLEGWRKQIFVAFAGFLLVQRYGTSLRVMMALFLTTQVLSWVLAPAIGRIIDRIGERRVLVTYFLGLAMCFTCYAAITHPIVLRVVFVIDHSLFALAMAMTSYVNRIVPKAEHTPTLSMGVAFNHIAACTMPLVGGWLWNHWGHQWVFGLGAIIALVSIAAALTLPKTAAPAALSLPDG